MAFRAEAGLLHEVFGIDDTVALVTATTAGPAAIAAGFNVFFQATAAVRISTQVADADALVTVDLAALLAGVAVFVVDSDAAVAARLAVPVG